MMLGMQTGDSDVDMFFFTVVVLNIFDVDSPRITAAIRREAGLDSD